MNIIQMRDLVTKAYSGPSWVSKVKNMSDSQVQAIYFRFIKEGKIKC